MFDDLKNFLVEAKRATYAAGEVAVSKKEEDGSTSLVYENGDWRYHDNYFGGEPFGGREVVFYQNKPIYIMVYYGRVELKINEFDKIYKFLQQALNLIPIDKPFRGPAEHMDENFIYKNNFTGEIDNFSGHEIIKDKNNQIIYQADYQGGLINQRN